ncbi:GbsR/MarR family transcriptional regulator [Phaeovulum sp.]|uniref:GbsR/MarR family transcriptional regulator n=1 Tax=Phaeovulum sp. TaxID=2934796 RepID=UPI0035694F28
MPSPRSDLVAIFTDAAALFGISRPAGQCLATIWRAPNPPDADAIMAATGLSRSAVSTALKELRETGMVHAERLQGTRRDGYSAPENAWALLRQHLALRLRRDLMPLLDRLAALPADPGAVDLAKMLAAVSAWLEALRHMTPAEMEHEFARTAPEPRAKKKKKKS